MVTKNSDNIVEIDLLKLMAALWKRAWAIIMAAVLGAAALGFYAAVMVSPVYESKAMLYVNNRTLNLNSSISISTGEISAANALVDTYGVILKSRSTLNEVIREANLPYSYEKLYKMISTGSVNDTQIFSVTVTDTNPEEAALIANTVAKVLPDKIAEVVDGSSVRVVDYAVTPTTKVAPSISKYALIGAFLGALAVCAVVFILELLDDVIHTEDYVSQTFGIPCLAVIPDLESDSVSKSKNYNYNYYYGDYRTSGGKPEKGAGK